MRENPCRDDSCDISMSHPAHGLEEELEALRERVAELEADLSCESHPGWKLVWCNECCRIDREAWQAALDAARGE